MPGPDPEGSQTLVPARPLTRRDVARLHRHRLEPAELQPWMERAARLKSPWARPGVDLVPNGTGWLLRVPAVTSQADRRGIVGFAALCAYLVVVNALDLLSGLGIRSGWMPVGAVASGVIATVMGLERGKVFRRARRLLARVEPLRSPGGPWAGKVVRVQGVVAEQPALPALFSGKPAVLFRNRIGTADELRGIDFELVLDDGHRLKVCVLAALLLDRPRRTRGPAACGPVSVQAEYGKPLRLHSDLKARPRLIHRFVEPRRYESSVGPGDRIEVCGLLKQEAAPDGEAAPGRGVPMRDALSAPPGEHLLVRKR